METADITALLVDWRRGDRAAFDRLLSLVHRELRAAAAAQLRRMGGVATLSPTALVNEAYLKLVDQTHASWNDRGHFMAVAATAMRHILVNYARASRAAKRGGNWLRVTYDENSLEKDDAADALLAVDEALGHLRGQFPRLASVVELRFFGGLTEREIAAVLDVDERTARRDWCKAKALLALSLSQKPASPAAA